MALYIIGLGLGDASDITLKGLALVKSAEKVYFENYTSVLQCSKEELEYAFKKKIILADRKKIENDLQEILNEAVKKNIAVLIIGDPFSATTHVHLFLEAKKRNIPTQIVHNASVISAIGCTGLQVYKFGKVVSIPFQETATSFFDDIVNNKKNGLHTLILLDLNPAEKNFLTIPEALIRLQKIEQDKKQKILGDRSVGCARIGAQDQLIVAGSSEQLQTLSWGKPPYCLVLPGTLHFVEEEALVGINIKE